MGRFSRTSQERLDTCHYDLRRLFQEVVVSYDCAIIEGHRGEGRQNRLFDEGKSTLKYPGSKHNAQPSLAVDVAPYPIEWENIPRLYHFAGFVFGRAETMGIRLRWGGDWDRDLDLDDQTFDDLVHFELG